ncbi:MAG: hypothetical protein E7445_08660 [Ruminococcaceae bacterium]|nr:hypothetical protein [Oscillospiraceae bacterium]
MTEWFWNFTAYSFFGYLLERLFAAAVRSDNQVRRCFRLLPLCPVYGFAVTAVLALPPQLLQLPWLPLWGGIVTTAAEYAVHWVYDRALGVQFWDYSPLRFHIHGRVCLSFSIAWGLLVTAAVLVIQPVLDMLIAAIPPIWTLSAMLLVTGDGLFTVRYLTVTKDVTFTVPDRRAA